MEVRGDEYVEATDGEFGTVQGLLVDRRSGHVKHLILQEHRLWAQRAIAVPIDNVAEMANHIRLKVTKVDVRNMSYGPHHLRGTEAQVAEERTEGGPGKSTGSKISPE